MTCVTFFLFEKNVLLERKKKTPKGSIVYSLFQSVTLWFWLMGFAAIYFLMLLCLNIFNHSFCHRSSSVHKLTCIETERQALLKFKHDLKYPSNMLGNWSTTINEDCCLWNGIVCDNVTGHVTELNLGSSTLDGKLNPSLLDLKSLSSLNLSGNNFRQFPVGFWKLITSGQLKYLNISRNKFQGKIPDLLTSHASVVLDLSFNKFTGQLPLISCNVTALDVSYNAMSGNISHFLCYRQNQLMKLEVLNLSNNLFSGEIPDCWENWKSMVAIKFCNNNFSGHIPNSMGNLDSLQSLHLRNNNLSGELPSSLRNCTKLLTIDFGGNKLSGEIPSWIGENLSKLIIISLKGNDFRGLIPNKICHLCCLQILDLSCNHLSGNIPRCISNLSAMVSSGNASGSVSYAKILYNTSRGCFYESLQIVMKGMVTELSTVLKLICLVDLSYNKLSGEIPEELTNLTNLISLNLSNNVLVGKIPDKIGGMTNLESVDLSENNLSGEIPISMPNLTFLSYLNLSYNNLIGKIPQSNQFQTFSLDSFLGNNLHGLPVTKARDPEASSPAGNNSGENMDGRPKVDWLYLCVEFGFLFGFVGVAGPILFTETWDFCILNFWDTLQKSLVFF